MSEKGSSLADPEFGVALPDVIDGTYEEGAKAALRDALKQLIEVEKVIRIDEFVFTYPRVNGSHITIVWTDLTTNEPDQVTI